MCLRNHLFSELFGERIRDSVIHGMIFFMHFKMAANSCERARFTVSNLPARVVYVGMGRLKRQLFSVVVYRRHRRSWRLKKKLSTGPEEKDRRSVDQQPLFSSLNHRKYTLLCVAVLFHEREKGGKACCCFFLAFSFLAALAPVCRKRLLGRLKYTQRKRLS